MRQEQCIQLRILVTTAAFCLVSCAPAKPTQQPEDEGNGARTEPERSETNQGEGGDEAGEDDEGDAAGDSKSDTRTIEVQTRDAKPCEPLQDKQKRADDQTSTQAYETFRSSARSQGTRTQASDTLGTVFRVPDTHTVYTRPQWGDVPNEVRFLGERKVEYEVSLEEKPSGGGEVEQRVETFVWPSEESDTSGDSD